MAPIFQMDFFQHFITPTLYNAWTGWGVSAHLALAVMQLGLA